jgi:histidinol-phosphatase
LDPAWRTRYELALEAAQQAGCLALRYFNGDFEVEWKQDRSPVTVADREAESLLQGRLLGTFPEDGFLGEESGDKAGSSGFRWIIDPIDGTRNFVRGIPIWGTLVGLEYKGEQIAGVVAVPALGQNFRALRGDGAYRDDRRLQVSAVAVLGEATLFHTSMVWFLRAGCAAVFQNLVERVQTERGYGDFYGHMLVAQGSGEIMVEHGVHPWDMAALKPIVEEAGGRFSDWNNNPTIYRPDVLVSNGKLHADALKILRGAAVFEPDAPARASLAHRVQGQGAD